MKAKRQALIREIVEKQSIQTQEELAEALRMQGMVVTQATCLPMMEAIAMQRWRRASRVQATA